MNPENTNNQNNNDIEVTNRDFIVAILKEIRGISNSIQDIIIPDNNKAIIEAIDSKMLALKGDKGDDGVTPQKGKDYKDGESIESAQVNTKGELILTLSNNKTLNCGVVVGKNGEAKEINMDNVVKSVLEKIKLPKYKEIEVPKSADIVKDVLSKIKLPNAEKETGDSILSKLKSVDLKGLFKYSDLSELPDLEVMLKNLTVNLRSSYNAITSLGGMQDVDFNNLKNISTDDYYLSYSTTLKKFVLKQVTGGGGGGITDGDKVDITVSDVGATWTVKNKAITYAKIQDLLAFRILGRGNTSGPAQELQIGAGLGIGGGFFGLNDIPANTMLGNNTEIDNSPVPLTATQIKNVLLLNNVNNTADLDKVVSNPTLAAINNAIVGFLDDRGNYNASTNVYPSTGGSGSAGAVLKGNLWTVSVGGTLGGVIVTPGDVIRALVDNPGQVSTNFAVSENNLGYVAENANNKASSFATLNNTLYPSTQAVNTELNSRDINNRDRANHTGTQLSSTISDFTESAQDAIGALLIDSNTIDVTYNDVGNVETIDVKNQMSINSDITGIKLVNDVALPGNNKVYGTDAAGNRGWKNDPSGGAGGVVAPVTTRIRRAVNQSIPTGAVYTDLSFDTSAYQVNGAFWTTGATITIPETGYYQIFSEATFDGAGLLAIATANMQVLVNGVSIIAEDEKQVAINSTAALFCMAQRNFTAGDTIKVQVKHSNSTAMNVLTQGDHSPDIILTKLTGVKGDKGDQGIPGTAGLGGVSFQLFRSSGLQVGDGNRVLVPFAGTITDWTIATLNDATGTITLSVKTSTLASLPTFTSIDGTEPIKLTAQSKNAITPTSWTTAVVEDQILEIKVLSITGTINSVYGIINITK